MNTFKYRGLKKKDYFEGWYFRITDAKTQRNYAVIYAITNNSNSPHAFIQVFNDRVKECDYIKSTIDTFSFNDEEVRINNSFLSMDNMKLETENHHFNINFVEKKTLNNMSAMGFLFKAPLECFQEILIYDGYGKGTIVSDGKVLEVEGKIYIEKTYGRRFPTEWIWLQSNHGDNGSSISFSTGKVPFGPVKINGFLCLLEYKEKVLLFSTSNLSKLRIDSKNNILTIKKGKYRLDIYPEMKDTIKLLGPLDKGVMKRTVLESLNSEAHIKLFEKGKLIFEDDYHNVGFEENN